MHSEKIDDDHNRMWCARRASDTISVVSLKPQRIARWTLAMAVVATMPLTIWGGGCSGTRPAVEPKPDASATDTAVDHTADTAGDTTDTAVDHTIDVQEDKNAAVDATIDVAADSSADDGASDAANGQGGESIKCCSVPSACSSDGKTLYLCGQTPPRPLAENEHDCSVNGYTRIWYTQTCATGCVDNGPSDASVTAYCRGEADAASDATNTDATNTDATNARDTNSDAYVGCCGPGVVPPPACSPDGTSVFSCKFMTGACGGGYYSYVWTVESCTNGCAAGDGLTAAACR